MVPAIEVGSQITQLGGTRKHFWSQNTDHRPRNKSRDRFDNSLRKSAIKLGSQVGGNRLCGDGVGVFVPKVLGLAGLIFGFLNFLNLLINKLWRKIVKPRVKLLKIRCCGLIHQVFL